MSRVARALSADSMRGRGPWTLENARAARWLAEQLRVIGAQPVFGASLLVPFTTAGHERDTSYNVVGVIRGRDATSTELVGITAHFDHLGVGTPDPTGDSIYNGFLDAALPVAMVLDVARRYAGTPADRSLLVMFFNLEEQGLVGSQALAGRADAAPLMGRLRLLIGVDAGAPAGEALEWQLMGGAPEHFGTRIADSLARAHGWTTTSTPPRPISDVYPFAMAHVPILFPIPGKTWRGYSEAQRAEAMRRFDHYHQPSDEWHADFPLTGTRAFAGWLYEILASAGRRMTG